MTALHLHLTGPLTLTISGDNVVLESNSDQIIPDEDPLEMVGKIMTLTNECNVLKDRIKNARAFIALGDVDRAGTLRGADLILGGRAVVYKNGVPWIIEEEQS